MHKRLGKAVTVHGKRCSMTICRQLYRLQAESPWPPVFAHNPAAAGPSGAPEKPPNKKGKKGNKAAAAAAKAVAGPSNGKLASQDEFCPVVEGGTLLLTKEVVASKTGVFEMEALTDLVKEAGRYGATLHWIQNLDTYECLGPGFCYP